MLLSDKINDIRKACYNNNLVVFVGSGVSINSRVTSWCDLIIRFPKKLGHDKCKKCNFKQKECPDDKCWLCKNGKPSVYVFRP